VAIAAIEVSSIYTTPNLPFHALVSTHSIPKKPHVGLEASNLAVEQGDGKHRPAENQSEAGEVAEEGREVSKRLKPDQDRGW
jgi:hypothetical protein